MSRATSIGNEAKSELKQPSDMHAHAEIRTREVVIRTEKQLREHTYYVCKTKHDHVYGTTFSIFLQRLLINNTNSSAFPVLCIYTFVKET